MKRTVILPVALCALLLGGCAAPRPDSGEASEGVALSAPIDHGHANPEESNVLAHERAGYCGNMVTTVRCHGGGEYSFWGSDSVTVSDLLRFLDYGGEVCRCPLEYTVDTEIGTGYGLNLSEGFARYNGGQTDLTAEQIEMLRQIILRLDQQPQA